MILDALLALAVLGVAGWTLAVRSSFAAVVGFVAYGLLLSLVWVRLGAVDVALTEAALGAGATGVLLLFAVVRLRGGRKSMPPHPAGRSASRRACCAAWWAPHLPWQC